MLGWSLELLGIVEASWLADALVQFLNGVCGAPKATWLTRCTGNPSGRSLKSDIFAFVECRTAKTFPVWGRIWGHRLFEKLEMPRLCLLEFLGFRLWGSGRKKERDCWVSCESCGSPRRHLQFSRSEPETISNYQLTYCGGHCQLITCPHSHRARTHACTCKEHAPAGAYAGTHPTHTQTKHMRGRLQTLAPCASSVRAATPRTRSTQGR